MRKTTPGTLSTCGRANFCAAGIWSLTCCRLCCIWTTLSKLVCLLFFSTMLWGMFELLSLGALLSYLLVFWWHQFAAAEVGCCMNAESWVGYCKPASAPRVEEMRIQLPVRDRMAAGPCVYRCRNTVCSNHLEYCLGCCQHVGPEMTEVFYLPVQTCHLATDSWQLGKRK